MNRGVIVAIPRVGLAPWRAVDSRYKDLRQGMSALRPEWRAASAALYQALFSRKDLAADEKQNWGKR